MQANTQGRSLNKSKSKATLSIDEAYYDNQFAGKKKKVSFEAYKNMINNS